MKSSKSLVAGDLYEIINPHVHYLSHDHIGWFSRTRVRREVTLVFLYLEKMGDYEKFLVDGNLVIVPRKYVRHLRPIKKENFLEGEGVQVPPTELLGSSHRPGETLEWRSKM